MTTQLNESLCPLCSKELIAGNGTRLDVKEEKILKLIEKPNLIDAVTFLAKLTAIDKMSSLLQPGGVFYVSVEGKGLMHLECFKKQILEIIDLIQKVS